MDVTVVIVSYNVADLLNECIVSINRETHSSYEIIVVDNNSIDNSVETLKANHPEVRLIQNTNNVGFAKANNQGFKEAKGRYFFMLNPDTVVLDKAIDKLVHFMDEHPDAGACGPKNLNLDISLQHNCHHFPTLIMRLVEHLQLKRFFPRNEFFGREHMTYWDYDEVKEIDWITGCSLMIRREALEQIGLLDENYFMYAEETDLCFRLKKHHWVTLFNPYASIIHYGGQSALKQNKEKVFSKAISYHLFTTKYYFFNKNYGYLSFFAIRSLDLIYYSMVYLKNIFRIDKNTRKEKIDQSKAVLSLIIFPKT